MARSPSNAAVDRTLRGKRLPVPAWEARQVVALRRGKDRSVLPEGPLVGRDGAVAIVKDLLEAVREERTPRLVSIIGQAGLGKSRIGWELEKYVDGVVEKIAWHHARSPAYGEGLGFWALAEMVRFRAEIAEGDPPTVARRRLAACLATYVPDDVERRWIAPHLAGLIGLGPVRDGGREETFAAWRSFFERVADTATTVLMFDDLHWADAGLLDFIEYLAQTAAGRPILVATLARPALLERRPDWAAGLRNAIVVQLDPLPRTAMGELLDGLAPGLPKTVAERVLDRAEGIPLYAVETLRMLVDRGELEAVDGAYRVRGSLDRLAIPETLQALVAARLDDLDPADRALIRDAAVLGQAFRPAALAAIGGSTEEAIAPNLDRLVQRELLVEETDERDPGRGSYRFVEWLVREVAYGTLSLRDRRERHLAAARYLETLDDPDLAAAVAGHMLAAHRSGPPGRADRTLALRGRHGPARRRRPCGRAPLTGAGARVHRGGPVDHRRRRRASPAVGAGRHQRPGARHGSRRPPRTPARRVDWHAAHGDHSARGPDDGPARLDPGRRLRDRGVDRGVRSAIEELVDDPALHDDPWLVELHGRPGARSTCSTAALTRGHRVVGSGPGGRRAARPCRRSSPAPSPRRVRRCSRRAGRPRGSGCSVRRWRCPSRTAWWSRRSARATASRSAWRPTIRGRRSRSPTWAWDGASPRFRDVAIRLVSNWAGAALESASGTGRGPRR